MQKTKNNIASLIIRLPKEVKKEFQIKTINNNSSMQEIILKLIIKYLNE